MQRHVEECPVCAGRCPFCGHELEPRELPILGYCRTCDVTYWPEGSVVGNTYTRKGRRR